jgi:hypothetical protein
MMAYFTLTYQMADLPNDNAILVSPVIIRYPLRSYFPNALRLA